MTTTLSRADANRRAWRHTWLTIGGGAVLAAVLILVTFYVRDAPPPSSILSTEPLRMAAVGVGIGISPAALIACLRQPLMRRLFQWAASQPTTTARTTGILLGTTAVFVGVVALVLVLFLGWALLTTAHHSSTANELKGAKAVSLISLAFALPWLLAALASAWYVNRDWLRNSSFEQTVLIPE
ncbi:hypothetical protein [Hymenobacter pini]|uniref:hypothetical protein n=1 Tax=Hymenobacter pini TaxID=2880879 RepID=UPI001CF44A8F|nr:hypothetical protein [Hymenobacter pini]MCA8831412.1 hypothetical protein [Hymenobacter pini]